MCEFFKRNTSTPFQDMQGLLPVFVFACNIASCKTTGHSPFYLMMAYAPSSARIYKHFCPRPSQATFAQNSTKSREEERLNVLDKLRKTCNKNLLIENYILILMPDKFYSLKVTKPLLVFINLIREGLTLKFFHVIDLTIKVSLLPYYKLITATANYWTLVPINIFSKTIIILSKYLVAHCNLSQHQYLMHTTLKFSSEINRG